MASGISLSSGAITSPVRQRPSTYRPHHARRCPEPARNLLRKMWKIPGCSSPPKRPLSRLDVPVTPPGGRPRPAQPYRALSRAARRRLSCAVSVIGTRLSSVVRCARNPISLSCPDIFSLCVVRQRVSARAFAPRCAAQSPEPLRRSTPPHVHQYRARTPLYATRDRDTAHAALCFARAAAPAPLDGRLAGRASGAGSDRV